MTKKEYCNNNPGMAILATSAFDGYVIHGIEYGIDDYVYITYRVDNKIMAYHRLKIHYGNRTYVLLHGRRLHFTDFSRLEVTK